MVEDEVALDSVHVIVSDQNSAVCSLLPIDETAREEVSCFFGKLATDLRLTPGTVIADRYEILALCGSGGMGAVFKSRDLLSNLVVALKLISAARCLDAKIVEKFNNESKILSTLSHAGIVSLSDYGQDAQGRLFIAMEYVEGQTLSKHIKEQGGFPRNQAIEIALQVCDAAIHAHGRGAIHGDIKPSNIMLTADQKLKLVDFGVSRVFQNQTPHTPLTETVESVGTPGYMSPEQCFGQPSDVRSDVYQLGCLLYELFSGKPAFDGATAFEVMFKHVTAVPNVENVDSALAQILNKALDKAPLNRYHSVESLKEDLMRLQSEPLNVNYTNCITTPPGGSSGICRSILKAPLAMLRFIWHSVAVIVATPILALIGCMFVALVVCLFGSFVSTTVHNYCGTDVLLFGNSYPGVVTDVRNAHRSPNITYQYEVNGMKWQAMAHCESASVGEKITVRAFPSRPEFFPQAIWNHYFVLEDQHGRHFWSFLGYLTWVAIIIRLIALVNPNVAAALQNLQKRVGIQK